MKDPCPLSVAYILKEAHAENVFGLLALLIFRIFAPLTVSSCCPWSTILHSPRNAAISTSPDCA